jgi:hypothetical protein
MEKDPYLEGLKRESRIRLLVVIVGLIAVVLLLLLLNNKIATDVGAFSH